MEPTTTGRSGPQGEVPEAGHYESHGAMLRIVMSLPPVESAYSVVRFLILRSKLLALMNLVLPPEGRILDVGCGFGLFSVYFALLEPRRAITGVDPNARRVKIATEVARRCGALNNVYLAGTAQSPEVRGPFDAIFMLDVLHHMHASEQRALLEHLRGLLAPGGVLLLKDITTDSYFKLKFTELLDRLMVGWKEPLSYRHHGEWSRMLQELGFRVRVVRVPDILPYPHVVLVAQ